jgi:glycosyltransferase involved in cell wall biosynthesis
LQNADILLHTAAWEAGVPLVALDAIRMGTPVVMLQRPEYGGILTSGLFDEVNTAVKLITHMIDITQRHALLSSQLLEIDAYLERNPVKQLAELYSSFLQ